MPVTRTSSLPADTKYSPARAERAVRFITSGTCHTKSRLWSGKPFIMADWQAGSARQKSGAWALDGIVRPLFGAVRWDDMTAANSSNGNGWVRRFELAWIELARKNGKSELLAALGLYLLIGDNEPGAEIYSAAADRWQASKVFNVAKDMVLLSPLLRKERANGNLEIIDSRKTMVYHPLRATYEAVSADAAHNLGSNPSAVLFDEVLAQPGPQLWEYLREGAGTRPNFLLLGVTTAGPDRDSFAFAEHELSLRVAADPDLDPKRFVYMAYTPEEADWEDEDHWFDANPGLFHPTHNPGGWLNIETLRGEAKEAKASGDLSKVQHFRIFRLNQWGVSKNRWLDMAVWDESETLAGGWTDADLNVPAYGGLDLASTTDITSWQVVFPTENRLMVLSRFWITRASINGAHAKMAGRFAQWERDGVIRVFEADVQDFDVIREQILEDCQRYNIIAIGFDQWQSPGVTNYIEQRTDVAMINIPQTTIRMDAGCKELTARMGNRQWTTNGNPLMRWMADNTDYREDNELKIKPSKKDSRENIDGIVAVVNAFAAMLIQPDEGLGQFYVLPECPRCQSSEVNDGGPDMKRCLECGWQWEEGDNRE